MKSNKSAISPLAERLRPRTLERFFGQEKVAGPGSFLEQMIKKDQLFSLILWGPPGSGKTTLAYIISHSTNSDFVQLSAVTSGKKELKDIITQAQENLEKGKRTILFIDEIHRWNKIQQDALLPHVERGTIVLIGATTENPSFEVINALLSRTRVIVLDALKEKDIQRIIKQALIDEVSGLGKKKIHIDDHTIRFISRLAGGDARVALNILELAAGYSRKINEEIVRQVVRQGNIYYDKDGERHYNIISALHKSLRGNDADASLYWLARMLEGGEDPLYIARRLLRFAAEDVGLANNNALLVAEAAFSACQKIGMPECSVHLAQCVVYLAKCKKSVAVYEAYKKASQDAKKYSNLSVPLHLRNAPTELMRELGYGKDYKYTPKEDSSQQKYFPEELEGRHYLDG